MGSKDSGSFNREEKGLRAAEAIIWLTAFAVSFALVPVSHNTSLVKLFFFTVLSGLLLTMSSALGKRRIDPVEAVFLLLITFLTMVTLRNTSNTGVTRLLLVCSASAVFFSVRTLGLRREKVLLPVVAAGTFAMLVSAVSGTNQTRLAGVFGNANLLGSVSAGLIPAGAALFLGFRRNRIVLAVCFTLIAIYVLYRSGTRSSVLALAAGIALASALRWRPGLFTTAAILFVLAVGFTALSPRLEIAGRSETVQVRRVIWSGAWRMFSRRPLIGWGTGSFQSEFPAFRDPDFTRQGVSANTAHAHSEPLEIIAENGIAGFLLTGTALFLLLRRAVKGNRTLLEWGVTASVLVILIESLASVALRWTSTVYLFAFMAALLPGSERRIRLRGATALVPAILGITLALAGGIKAYRNTRASRELGLAMQASASGMPVETVLEHCEKALDFNSDHTGAWYTLGNTWGLRALYESGETRISSLRNQVAAYDSLELRAPDFAWMRQNRIEPLVRLGMLERAMDDIIHVYRTRTGERQPMIDRAYLIAPAVDAGGVLVIMNLELCGVLASERSLMEGGDSGGRRVRNVHRAILTAFSVAGVECPEVLDTMRGDLDSIMTESGIDSEVFLESIDLELSVCSAGALLLMRAEESPPESVIAEALVPIMEGMAAPFHRAALISASAAEGRGRFIDTADEHLRIMIEACRGYMHLVPGSPDCLAETALISAAHDDPDHVKRLSKYFLYACALDASGANSFLETGFACGTWVAAGGPLAEGFHHSDETVSGRLRNTPGSESLDFRVTFVLAENAIVLGAGEGDSLSAADAVLEVAGLLFEALESHGYERGFELFLESSERVLAFLEKAPFDDNVAEAAEFLLYQAMETALR